jgi:hypothetical protein
MLCARRSVNFTGFNKEQSIQKFIDVTIKPVLIIGGLGTAAAGLDAFFPRFAVENIQKLAITMWSRSMALSLSDDGPAIVAVNPRSMPGSKMVKEAYGAAGGNLRIGAEFLCRAALSDEFADASGRYFDNDIGQFASPHPDALDIQKREAIVRVIEAVLAEKIQ